MCVTELCDDCDQTTIVLVFNATFYLGQCLHMVSSLSYSVLICYKNDLFISTHIHVDYYSYSI